MMIMMRIRPQYLRVENVKILDYMKSYNHNTAVVIVTAGKEEAPLVVVAATRIAVVRHRRRSKMVSISQEMLFTALCQCCLVHSFEVCRATCQP